MNQNMPTSVLPPSSEHIMTAQRTAKGSSSPSHTSAIPPGWTDVIPAAPTIEVALGTMINLPSIKVRLAEVGAARYLFQSGDKYYIWNTVTEDSAEVTDPVDYDKILDQIGKDITKVQVKQLPEPEGLEGQMRHDG